MFKTLMYHYIDDNIKHPMCVSRQSFYEQIRYLHNERYQFVTLDDMHNIINNNKKCEKSILITFDDGYKNTIDTALPILNEFNASAVVSLCSSYIDKDTCPEQTIHISQEFAVVSEINDWILAGNDIAAHTYSHPKLTHLDREDFIKEICKDKEILEDKFKKEINTFFYPFGSVNDQVEKIVRDNYKFAFVTNEGVEASIDNKYRIHRIYVNPNWSLQDFENNINK